MEKGNPNNANNEVMEDIPVERMDSLDGKQKNHGEYIIVSALALAMQSFLLLFCSPLLSHGYIIYILHP